MASGSACQTFGTAAWRAHHGDPSGPQFQVDVPVKVVSERLGHATPTFTLVEVDLEDALDREVVLGEQVAAGLVGLASRSGGRLSGARTAPGGEGHGGERERRREEPFAVVRSFHDSAVTRSAESLQPILAMRSWLRGRRHRPRPARCWQARPAWQHRRALVDRSGEQRERRCGPRCLRRCHRATGCHDERRCPTTRTSVPMLAVSARSTDLVGCRRSR